MYLAKVYVNFRLQLYISLGYNSIKLVLYNSAIIGELKSQNGFEQ
jgi:hypothetical protein